MAAKSRADLQRVNEKKTNHGDMTLFKQGGRIMANSSRTNRLEELGRVNAEKARTPKGKANLAAEKKRIVGEMKFSSGGITKAKMGSVKTAAPSKDGVASKGKTKGTMVSMKGMKPLGMCSGGMSKGKK